MNTDNIINLKALQEEREINGAVDDILAACCFYALRDITQEINDVLKIIKSMETPIDQELVKILSKEDLHLFIRWIERHGDNLINIARSLKRTAPKQQADLHQYDEEKLITRAREWDNYGDNYNKTRKTIIDGYLELTDLLQDGG